MARAPENPVKPFNNPDVVTQSWYVLAKSKEVRRGRALTKELLGRRIALYRGDSGRVYALDARCPHLGANLGQGKVIGDELRCSFHHWTYSGEGTCTSIPYRDTIPPGARTFSYPTEEKYGVIWIFNGPVPSFPLPSFPKEQRLRMIRLSPKTLNCHPHVIIPNGLDMNHWNSVHGFPLMDEPIVDIPDKFRVSVRCRLAVSGRLRGLLSLLGIKRITATYTAIGGNLATSFLEEPWELYILFTQRPLLEGRSESQTFLFFPDNRGITSRLGLDSFSRIAKLMSLYLLVLRGDRQILDTIEFQSNLTKEDKVLAAFIDQVNGMDVFDAAEHDALD